MADLQHQPPLGRQRRQFVRLRPGWRRSASRPARACRPAAPRPRARDAPRPARRRSARRIAASSGGEDPCAGAPASQPTVLARSASGSCTADQLGALRGRDLQRMIAAEMAGAGDAESKRTGVIAPMFRSSTITQGLQRRCGSDLAAWAGPRSCKSRHCRTSMRHSQERDGASGQAVVRVQTGRRWPTRLDETGVVLPRSRGCRHSRAEMGTQHCRSRAFALGSRSRE